MTDDYHIDKLSDLGTLWSVQFDQQQLWHNWANMTQAERDGLVKELLLHLHEEVAELQRGMNQSRYHLLKQRDPSTVSNLAEAGVDVFKLLVALLQLGGVSAEMFAAEFDHKTKRVAAQWAWERDDLQANIEVLLCDIDGVIAKWLPAYHRWATVRGVKPELEDSKDAFHSSGGFREIEPDEEMVRLLNEWRNTVPSSSVQRRLIMVTARPYKRFRRIFTDTVWWLKEHGLQFDHILFERDKAEAVRLVQPARIIGHIEDRGKHALEVAATGVKVIKLPFEGTEERVEHPNIHHVTASHEIAEHLGMKGWQR